MFPPNLQKNIQELERQISLLETECEHMEAEKQETTPPGKSLTKSLVRELPKQPFITGPCISTSSYSPSRMLNLPPVVPRMYSVSCSHFRMTKEKLYKFVDAKRSQDTRNNRFKDSQPIEKGIVSEKLPTKCSESDESNEQFEEDQNPLPTDQKPNVEQRKDKIRKRSITSILEVCETSEDNLSRCVSKHKIKLKTKKSWNELYRNQNNPNKRVERNKNNDEFTQQLDDKYHKSYHEVGTPNWPDEYQPQRLRSKRRLRSARTKKNDIPINLNTVKTFFEKETQCFFNEDKEKEQFFVSLNDSLQLLSNLIEELKTKISREKRDDVLKDMQNILLKITENKYINATLDPLASLKNNPILEQNLFDVKSTLLSLKKFCKELSDEKTALTDELSMKSRIITEIKRKEKEYLSIISSLKYHLDKTKEEAEEGEHAKRDLKILKLKLQEEAKVIEALKKSHKKMQDLIENYVLENDNLRAQVKITKLESEKYTVLLAGKEAEINKHKKEIESFQRQITQQLSLLRSKASENEVEQTIKAITDQNNYLETEIDSNGGKKDYETLSSSTATLPKNPTEELPSTGNPQEIPTDSTALGTKRDDDSKPVADTSNESDGDGAPVKRQFGLERVLSSSKNLRTSINELLEDIRRESSDLYWLSPCNSYITSSQSVLISTSSDDISEVDQND